MKAVPVKDLNLCSVRGCHSATTVIVQRMIGPDAVMFGYCSFHETISGSFFQQKDKVRIRL